MQELLTNALSNLSSPMILFFILGFIATMLKSDLEIPEAIAKGLAIYFMMAIGFKGGAEIAKSGLTNVVITSAMIALLLGSIIPVISYFVLHKIGKIDAVNSCAISAHYGSVSVVTFVTAISFLGSIEVDYSGFMVGMMAIMESPAIFISILMLRIVKRKENVESRLHYKDLIKESLFNASIVLLFGSMLIGYYSGNEGMEIVYPFFVTPFNGILTLFLLEMGMLAGKRIGEFRAVGIFLFIFGVTMPLINGIIAAILSLVIGLDIGDRLLFTVLSASASYIAAPAAVRLAMPQANPSYYITMSLAITFPFNIMFGIPVYYSLCNLLQ